MVVNSFRKMARGGIYDQIGGGFARYSVDASWLVPHFEKMLYDNAMLARAYVLAHRAFGGDGYARVARETLDYLLAEMTPQAGGFFAAQDADSEGGEGAFYVWNPSTLKDAVGPEAAPIMAARFGVTAAGNFEGAETVLSVVRSVPELAADFARPEKEIASILEASRRKMYAARAKRPPPATDEKLLTDWTALTISAFALAGRIFSERRYEAAARRAADRILETCRRGKDLLHRQKDGDADIAGFSSDYANGVEALLDLYEGTFEPRYFRAAVELQAVLDERFFDPSAGYYLSAQGHDGLILRPRETFDGATPSSNSVAAMNLLRLASFTGDHKYRERAETLFTLFSGYLERAPAAFPRLLCALDYFSDTPHEVVLAGEPGRPDFEALREAVFAHPGQNRVVAHADAGGAIASLSPLVASRESKDGRAAAYVCQNFSCRRPTDDPAELAALLND